MPEILVSSIGASKGELDLESGPIEVYMLDIEGTVVGTGEAVALSAILGDLPDWEAFAAGVASTLANLEDDAK